MVKLVDAHLVGCLLFVTVDNDKLARVNKLTIFEGVFLTVFYRFNLLGAGYSLF